MVNILATLSPALIEFNCATFNRISRNATDSECQRACVDHCRDGEPQSRLTHCLLNTPMACQIQADITHLTLPTQACGSERGIRLRYPARPILSPDISSMVSTAYSGLERTQIGAHFKIMTTGQSVCSGEYAICDTIFGDGVSNLDDCSIAKSGSGCFAVNATRVRDNFISFDHIDNMIMGSHPFFGGENVDIQIRLASEVFGTTSACPKFKFTNDGEELRNKSSVISRERIILAGLQ